MKNILLLTFFLLTISLNNLQAQLKEPLFDRNGMPQATSLAVLDMQVDDKAFENKNGDDLDAVVTARVIQGLVNRQSQEKIYLLNDANDQTHGDWHDHQEGWLQAAEELKELPQNGLIRYPERNGGLRRLLENYQDYIKGVVIWDEQIDGHVRQATCAAAVTIAAQQEGIAVSPALYELVTDRWGYDFPVIKDLRKNNFSTDYEVLNWQVKNFWAGSNPKMRAVFSMGLDGIAPHRKEGGPEDKWWSNFIFNEGAIDYAVAANGFTFNIDMADKNDDQALLNLLSHYEEGKVAILGWVPTHPGGTRFQEYPHSALDGTSYYVLGGNGLSNLSVLGSFPDSNVRLPKAKAHNVHNNDVFVALLSTDGDALHVPYLGLLAEFHTLRSEYFGRAPVTWTMAPQLANLAPPIYNYFVHHLPEGSDMVIGWADKTNHADDSGLDNLAEHWKQYSKLSDMKIMWTVHSSEQSQRADIINWEGIIVGYANSRVEPGFSGLNDKTAVLGTWSFARPGRWLSDDNEELKKAVKEFSGYLRQQEDQPVFMTIRIPTPFPGKIGNIYKAAKLFMEEVNKASIDRDIHFLPARDVVATYMHFKKINDRQ